jgi:NADPH:quinone reductase-like Zn-dependent oxidoreductase
LPLTLGSDLSGTIESVGTGVTDFKSDDEVFGVTNPRFTGANAEYAIASARMIAAKPKNITHIEAASIPVVAVTAWQMLFDHGGVKRDQTVLILGAAGNVGSYAVQLAHAAGAQVIASAASNEMDYVRSLGAERLFDGRAQRLPNDLKDIDVVIDAVGGEAQTQSLDALRLGGVLISAVSQPDQSAASRLGIKAAFMLVDVTTAALKSIAELLQANKLKTNVGTVLDLTELRRAHEMLDGSRPRRRGKIVIDSA